MAVEDRADVEPLSDKEENAIYHFLVGKQARLARLIKGLKRFRSGVHLLDRRFRHRIGHGVKDFVGRLDGDSRLRGHLAESNPGSDNSQRSLSHKVPKESSGEEKVCQK